MMTEVKNLTAFLDMLAFAEGTYGKGDDGYNILVGGSHFKGYADHPRELVLVNKKKNLKSTAAGRYQILQRTYDEYRIKVKVTDFSKASQDAIAKRLISDHDALDDVNNGDIKNAIKKVKSIWASLPGSGYGQHEHSLDTLLKKYEYFGGSLAKSD